MSSEALSVVRAFFASDDDDAIAEKLDPEVVWFGTRGGLDEGQVMRGPQAVLDYLHEIQDAWERYDIDVEQFLEAGDAVVALMRERAQARHGGVHLEDDTAMILKVRNGRIVEMRGYLDRAEALRAAGLNA
jgi:ketosteroid isomerase-like protein